MRVYIKEVSCSGKRISEYIARTSSFTIRGDFFLIKRVPLYKKGKGRAKSSDEEELDYTFIVGSIASFKTGFFDGVPKEDRFVAFVDPSTYPSSPAWMLRNYLVLMRQAWGLTDVQVLCYRDIHALVAFSGTILAGPAPELLRTNARRYAAEAKLAARCTTRWRWSA